LRAELLALALPTHPFARQLETAPSGIPTRAAAAAVWAASQHPERSVHVLVGDFDVAATAATLREVFATTTLRPSTRPPAPLPRPLGGARRSQLQGVHPATVALAWPLPPDVDRIALATAATWLADGPDSELGQRLLRREQRQATVRCQAPWPPAADGQSLFVIEISHTGQEPPLAALTDLVRTTLQEVLAKPPTDSQLQASHLQLQRRWRQSTADPRQLAVELAAVALTWPRSTPDRSWPERLDVVAVQRLLAGLAGSQPAIVEGKP
jgi:predicted Zn-dependent peptidase